MTNAAITKLSYLNFPFFAFFLAMAPVLIVTLFRSQDAQSVPLFQIFLFLIPFQIFISATIVRAYEDLDKYLLGIRIVTTILFVATLFYVVGLRNTQICSCCDDCVFTIGEDRC